MKKTFDFLKKLKKNNERGWFKAQKDTYDDSQAEFKTLVTHIEDKLKAHDLIDESGTKIFRIYRDVRFSKDKTPYNLHRSASFKRATNTRRGGYYLRVEPGNCLLAGGFWRPNAEDLLLMRQQIEMEPDRLRDILNNSEIKNYFGELEGEKLKTTPKGFDKESEAIDLLRYKGFILTHKFSDEEALSDNFAELVNDGYVKMRPFLDYMTEIVTTDLNGESLID